jgi:ribosomal protein S18 acetylase RimI-like enzyme
MDIATFKAYHLPALEQHEARHFVLLGLLTYLSDNVPFEVRLWSLGEPGACAAQIAGDDIILGDLNESQCHALAEQVFVTDFTAVLGPDDTTHWFTARARQLGIAFKEPLLEYIYELTEPPVFPIAPGEARQAALNDLELFWDWISAFYSKIGQSDLLPSRDWLAEKLRHGQILFWELQGKPVAMAGCLFQSRNGGSIGYVYTPPELRGRGYGGAATAAVAARFFAQRKGVAWLYVDMKNTQAQHCYARIGFKPVCGSGKYLRDTEGS